MAGDRAVVTAVFGEADGPLLPFALMMAVGPEIPVDAFDIAAALVVPAAGVVDGTGRIPPADKFRGFKGVELAPALVERHPHGKADGIIQQVGQLPQFLVVMGAGSGIGAGKKAVAVILYLQAEVGEHIDAPGGIGVAAVYHILPDQHPQPVAVVVPAQRLHLDVLAQHIKAQPLHFGDIVDHRFIAGGGVKTVAPVALIQQTVVEIRLTVEEQAGNPVFIRPDAEGAHPEVALHRIAAGQGNGDVVKKRILRTPGAQILRTDKRGGRAGFIDPVLRDHNTVLAHYNIGPVGLVSLQLIIHPPGGKLRGDAQSAQVILRDALQPDRLPDAGLRRIPDTAVFQPLLAAGKSGGIGGVGDAKLDEQGIFP